MITKRELANKIWNTVYYNVRRLHKYTEHSLIRSKEAFITAYVHIPELSERNWVYVNYAKLIGNKEELDEKIKEIFRNIKDMGDYYEIDGYKIFIESE